MESKKEMTDDASADSPTSVFENELEEKIVLDAEDGDSSHIPRAMLEEEERLLQARLKEKAEQNEPVESTLLNDSHYEKLNGFLTMTESYTKFLLEKMEDITLNGLEQETEGIEKKRGRGSKRKAANQYNNKKAKKAVAAMLARPKENGQIEAEEEQKELVPLLTGGQLKPYQLKGVKWLISLWQNGLNGILADQMGLGKTIQTIAFLAHLKGNGMHGPYLIIAPLSTLSNWQNEITRFTPTMNAIIYHGNKETRDEIRRKHMPAVIGPKFPIVITSYDIALSDARRCLKHYLWKYVVIDEGHRLKNSNCKLLKQLKILNVENKLLLTGTPLQNNLAELWSLLHFLMPQIFQDREEFESWFNLSGMGTDETVGKEVEKRRLEVVAKLHAILRPFLLRRMKSDVEQMLPPKKEIILYATLTEHQKNFQDHLVNKTLEDYLREKVDTGRGMKGKLNNLMVQLRKNCNHPDLLESAFDGSFTYPPVEKIVEQCGKFRLLDRLLVQLFARKHKVLIFSQWTKILDIMDYYLSEKGFEEVFRIDGGVNLDERKRQIEKFNDVNSNCPVFLLSTRAGGLGINLTAADTCILYDSDWNPQMDLQAMDRCHRIGQTKPVHVYRLATAQSVECRILKRAASKLKLEHVVIGKGKFHQERKTSTETTEEEELLALLRNDETTEDKMIQTDISDEDLERVLDRSNLIVGGKVVDALPLKGPGWEVVIPTGSGSVLSTLNN